jgi:hypothetical protein
MSSDMEKYRSKIQKKFKELENKFDILNNDIIELKWEIDDIKEILLQSNNPLGLSYTRCSAIHKSTPKKKKSKPQKIDKVIQDDAKHRIFNSSNTSDNETESD